MKNRAWAVYPVVAILAMVVWYLVDRPPIMFNLIGLASPVLILVALRMWRPEKRLPWVLFAVGQFVFITGDVISYNYEKFNSAFPKFFPLDTDGLTPFPGWADAFYLAVYVFLIAGVLVMIHARTPGRDRASFVDALMLSIGLGTISWVLLISPQATADGVPLAVKLTSMAYPMADVLLLAAAIRLAVGAGRKPPAFWFMISAIVTLFVTDAIYGWLNLYTANGYQPGQGPLEAGWMAFYVLFAVAALHPSMRLLSEQARETDHRLSARRLVLLAGASLVAPLLIAYEVARQDGFTHDAPVLIGATIVLFILAVVRMWDLMRKQEGYLRREQALREAGANLVTATSRESIHEAAGRAIRSIAGDAAAVRICEAGAGSGELLVVTAVGGRASTGRTDLTLDTFQEWRRERLVDGHGYQVMIDDSVLREPLGLPADHATAFVAPLFTRDELTGILVVSVPELSRQVSESLESLTSQVALALESAALTEDLLIQQSQARFASLVKHSSDLVMVIAPDTEITYASPSATRVLGHEPQELEGMRFADLIAQEDRAAAMSFLTAMSEDQGMSAVDEFRVVLKGGEVRYVETIRTNLMHDPNVKGIVLNSRDVTERKEFEEELQHQALHDALTGLANRALFPDRVQHALDRQLRDGRPVSVLFMDLDDFKTINDSLGHAAGDQVLREIGVRLLGNLRTADTAARLGGDEFAVLLEDGGEEGMTAADVAERILSMMDEPFLLDGTEVFVRASIGISVAEPGDVPESAEELLRNADVAMYLAKEKGKNRYQLFEPAMHDTALKRLELKAALQRALEHDEFRLFYQPVIELESGKVSGVEALIRWFHPERGMVPPLDFIPLAEETGLIVPIGHWVLKEACRYAAELQGRYPLAEPLHMAVNLSARQVARTELVDEVREILTDTGLDPSTLILEITESVMIQDMDLAIARLTELKALGVQLAIDDFGTGYSSLNYVRRFPVDILKVDKSFIDGVTEGGESSALTAAVIELASILNLRPVAEGIERADQLQRLLELQCDLGQGFLFAKPLPDAELEPMLADRLQMAAEAAALSEPAE
ncbi:MAG TPA: EAL domain-containing protein [Actinomycetota bacterium]|nr:EAL domain-containing protein [Actinomycetota bacterium]